jgi:hypothetical protein
MLCITASGTCLFINLCERGPPPRVYFSVRKCATQMLNREREHYRAVLVLTTTCQIYFCSIVLMINSALACVQGADHSGGRAGIVYMTLNLEF